MPTMAGTILGAITLTGAALASWSTRLDRTLYSSRECQGTPRCRHGGRATYAPPPPARQGQLGIGLPPAAPFQGPQGQQWQPPVPIPWGGGATTPPATSASQAPLAQQHRGAQIAVQPPAGHGGAGARLAQAPTSMGANGTPPQEYLGISSALERLAPIMTDADTARSLQWQLEVDGDATKLALGKIEATALPGLQF